MDIESIKEFPKKMLKIQEEERKRISRDLHDEAGQLSISLGSALNIIEKEIERNNLENALRVIKDAKSILNETTKKLKSLVLDIRPAALDILGLAATLREHFAYYTKSYPLNIKFKENIANVTIKEEISITLYRIIQESLNNIVKHSKATNVTIELVTKNGELNLAVSDNGVGCEEPDNFTDGQTSRLGIIGMKERAVLLNGIFSFESRPQKGTTIKVSFPLEGI